MACWPCTPGRVRTVVPRLPQTSDEGLLGQMQGKHAGRDHVLLGVVGNFRFHLRQVEVLMLLFPVKPTVGSQQGRWCSEATSVLTANPGCRD